MARVGWVELIEDKIPIPRLDFIDYVVDYVLFVPNLTQTLAFLISLTQATREHIYLLFFLI